MALPIRVEALGAPEARDLVEALAVRGLIGTVEHEAGAYTVELNEPHEETERLLADLTLALEAWLADRGHDAVEIHVGGRTIPVAPAPSLEETLRSRLRRGTRWGNDRP